MVSLNLLLPATSNTLIMYLRFKRTKRSVAKPRKQSTGESEYSKTVTWLETDAFEHVPICALGPDVSLELVRV
jgi:hypothetical protein